MRIAGVICVILAVVFFVLGLVSKRPDLDLFYLVSTAALVGATFGFSGGSLTGKRPKS